MRMSARFVGFLGATLCAIALSAPAASSSTGTIAMSIGESKTQMGRIFRDATPSSCPSKAYPGPFNSETSFGYETYSFTAPLTGCVSFTRTSASCEFNAHLSVYEKAYEPASQSTNYLGDPGSSGDGNTFSVEVTAGQTYVIVATNTTSAESCDVTVELSIPGYVPPDTVIDSGPSGAIASEEATFEFHGEPEGDTAKVQCQIDGGGFGDCTSPKTFAGLAEGEHTVEFRAETDFGFQDATPASRTFTVDMVPPDTVIDSGPFGTIASEEATFEFHGEPGGDTAKVQCQIDGGGFGDCTSPKTFAGLADGAHTVEFRAEDAAGNKDGSPASREFSVSLPAGGAGLGESPASQESSVSTACASARAALAAARRGFNKAKKRFNKAKEGYKRAKKAFGRVNGSLAKAKTTEAMEGKKKRLKTTRKTKKAAVRRLKAAKAVAASCT